MIILLALLGLLTTTCGVAAYIFIRRDEFTTGDKWFYATIIGALITVLVVQIDRLLTS